MENKLLSLIYVNWNNNIKNWSHLVDSKSLDISPPIKSASLLLGLHCKQDVDAALIILCDNRMYCECINMLGWCYENGIGVDEDKEHAFNLYINASAAGSSMASFNIAHCLIAGSGVVKSENGAVEWCIKSADQGNPVGLLNLALLYEHGKYVCQNITHALDLLHQSSNCGNNKATFLIGYYYEYGRGVSRDLIAAIKYYEKAAYQGCPDAIIKIGPGGYEYVLNKYSTCQNE